MIVVFKVNVVFVGHFWIFQNLENPAVVVLYDGPLAHKVWWLHGLHRLARDYGEEYVGAVTVTLGTWVRPCCLFSAVHGLSTSVV